MMWFDVDYLEDLLDNLIMLDDYENDIAKSENYALLVKESVINGNREAVFSRNGRLYSFKYIDGDVISFVNIAGDKVWGKEVRGDIR